VKPLVIAHRGNSAEFPENTLASFASALELGARFVEFDVQLTADGRLVVIHDATLERTTDGRGDVRQMTLAEVRAVSAGYPRRFGTAHAGLRVPTLGEVLELLAGRARPMIEVKSDSVDPAHDRLERLLVEELRRSGQADAAALLSFSHLALLRCRDLAPEIPRGHLFVSGEPAALVAQALEAGCAIVMPEKGALSDELRERCREAGLRLATWVVDDPADLPGLLRFDLYGFGSNRPRELLAAVERLAG
jgi:glycerophosphoryl diester phosphodiesterase